jgi:hypothetical protein
MNVNDIIIKVYENETLSRRGKNKPNTNPIQTQSKPIQSQLKPIKCQNKPNTNPIHPPPLANKIGHHRINTCIKSQAVIYTLKRIS